MGKVDYLRLSVTDRCNLNCIYCTPLEKAQFLTHTEVLRFEEIVKIVEIFVALGVRKVRVTGGEPLIKKGIIDLIAMLKNIKGLEEISMTTNGVLLLKHAVKLKAAGLDRINISLDTLKKDRFKKITGVDCLSEVLAGIAEAQRAGLSPLKLNVIPMKEVNDDEIIDFARLTIEHPLIIRFIEFFYTNQRSKNLIASLITGSETKKIINKHLGKLVPAPETKGNGPAIYYALPEAKGSIGFISGSTGNFCDDCNRIRVDCAGRISPCLFSGHLYDARKALRRGKYKGELFDNIKRIMEQKSNHTKYTINEPCIEMSSLGG